MESWRKLLVRPEAPVREAIRAIDAGNVQICLVTDDKGRLLGTITDGDIRRGILKSLSLDVPASSIMSREPLVGRPDNTREELRQLMQRHSVRHVPLVDSQRTLVGVVLFDEVFSESPSTRDNCVVLMAGGMGRRLRPLTEHTPKPLLKVGNKPLLETILESLAEYRLKRFYISINYKADLVKEYFGNGSNWGVSIEYLEEASELGTAGALSLIDPLPSKPVVVINGDVLTRANYGSLLDFHVEQGAKATMCVREYDFQVPFGVVNLQGQRIIGIDEKPVQRFLVNAGMYVLDPEILAGIPKGQRVDMTDLFRRVIDEGHVTAVFPIREYWLDVGRLDDFERANHEFPDHFNRP